MAGQSSTRRAWGAGGGRRPGARWARPSRSELRAGATTRANAWSMPCRRARSWRPLTSARARRIAMYSKNESVPPGRSSRSSKSRICSTSATAKLLSGRPEMIRSYWPSASSLPPAGAARGCARRRGERVLHCRTAFEAADELVVELDQVELVIGSQAVHDLGGYRAGARPDFQHAARGPDFGRRTGPGPGRESVRWGAPSRWCGTSRETGARRPRWSWNHSAMRAL